MASELAMGEFKWAGFVSKNCMIAIWMCEKEIHLKRMFVSFELIHPSEMIGRNLLIEIRFRKRHWNSDHLKIISLHGSSLSFPIRVSQNMPIQPKKKSRQNPSLLRKLPKENQKNFSRLTFYWMIFILKIINHNKFKYPSIEFTLDLFHLNKYHHHWPWYVLHDLFV